jgi:hypothetical protein
MKDAFLSLKDRKASFMAFQRRQVTPVSGW